MQSPLMTRMTMPPPLSASKQRPLLLRGATALCLIACLSACGEGSPKDEMMMNPEATGGASLDDSGSGGMANDDSGGGSTDDAEDSSSSISRIQVVRHSTGARVSIFSGYTDYERRAAERKASFEARGCETTSVADCKLTVCEHAAEATEVDATTGTLLSMGDVTFETSNGIEDPLAGTIAFNDGYTSEGITGDLGGGEQITVSTTGADIPAFSTTLLFPLAPLFAFTASTSVAPDGYATVLVSRNESLPLKWDARGSSSRIETVQFSPSGSENAPSLSCDWDASAGEGVIPQELISQLLPGTQFLVMGTNRSTVTTAAGDVELIFAFPGLNPEKNASPRYELQ